MQRQPRLSTADSDCFRQSIAVLLPGYWHRRCRTIIMCLSVSVPFTRLEMPCTVLFTLRGWYSESGDDRRETRSTACWHVCSRRCRRRQNGFVDVNDRRGVREAIEHTRGKYDCPRRSRRGSSVFGDPLGRVVVLLLGNPTIRAVVFLVRCVPSAQCCCSCAKKCPAFLFFPSLYPWSCIPETTVLAGAWHVFPPVRRRWATAVGDGHTIVQICVRNRGVR